MNILLITAVLSALVPKPNIAAPADKADLCFAETLCAIKESIRWGTPKWNQAMCYRVANAIIKAEKRNQVSRDLILAVIINESDMNEVAIRKYVKDGRVVSQDGGLMGGHCKLGKDGSTCTNYLTSEHVKAADFFKPEFSIARGATWLKKIRDDGSCPHIDHPWFAHYNWGAKVFRVGVPRSYPQRVAVLWRAISDLMGRPNPGLADLRFVQVKGKKKITIDTPVGQRHKDLVAKIKSCSKYACVHEEQATITACTALASE